jgi:hypothetical protein
MNRGHQRAIALKNARDRASDPDFKLLWDMKLRELIELAEKGEKGKWANLIK